MVCEDFYEYAPPRCMIWGRLSQRIVKTWTNERISFLGETVLKTILITGSIGMVVGFAGTLLTLFGGGSIRVEYLEFAVALLLFLVMLIGAYWFVVGEPGTGEGRQPRKKRRFP